MPSSIFCAPGWRGVCCRTTCRLGRRSITICAAGSALAAEGSPIIINNACVSWHELAGRFLFSNARAYIGTLFSVSDIEAEAIVVSLLDKHFGKLLPHALWSAQNAVYGKGGDRRPYLVTGVYPQRLRVTTEDVPRRILSRLRSGQKYWRQRAEAARADDA